MKPNLLHRVLAILKEEGCYLYIGEISEVLEQEFTQEHIQQVLDTLVIAEKINVSNFYEKQMYKYEQPKTNTTSLNRLIKSDC